MSARFSGKFFTFQRKGFLCPACQEVTGAALRCFGREYLHVIGNNINRCALHTIFVGVLALCDPAFNIDLRAFVQVGVACLCELPPGYDVEPFSLFTPFTIVRLIIAVPARREPPERGAVSSHVSFWLS